MNTTHGVWGTRTRTFEWDGGIVTILFLEPMKCCSWHLHKTAYNHFYVISGELQVRTDKGYVTTLKVGQSFTVEPRVKHQFITGETPTIIEEIAYVKYNEYDIDRETIGGSVT